MAKSLSVSVIILAAGHGTRMKSNTLKLLHEVGGLPILSHVKQTAEALNPDQITFVISPDMKPLEEIAKPHQTVIQKEPKGTAHAVQTGFEGLKKKTDIVLIMLGDGPMIMPRDAQALIDTISHDDQCDAVFMGAQVQNPRSLGRMIVSENGTLDHIVEETDASAQEKNIRLVNSGLVALRAVNLPAYLKEIKGNNKKGELYLTDLPKLIASKKRKAIAMQTDPMNIIGVNTRLDLAQAEAIYQSRLRLAALESGVTLMSPHTTHLSYDTQFAQDVIIEPNVVIGKNVTLDTSVRVRAFSHLEDVHIKKNASIGPFARIRGDSDIGEDVRIGNFVEVKKSIIGKGTKAGHLTYLGDATIGDDVNIGAGSITCNYDGTSKHPTHIGDNSFIGSNTLMIAPVTIGKDVLTAAGSVITDDVADHDLAVSRAEQRSIKGGAKKYLNKTKQ